MKTAIIDVKGKEYKFCLTRESIKWLEARGITLQDIEKKMVTFIDDLWCAGLVHNYPDMTEKEAIQLQEDYRSENGDIMEIVKFLTEEYGNFINALTDTKSKKKKAKIV